LIIAESAVMSPAYEALLQTMLPVIFDPWFVFYCLHADDGPTSTHPDIDGAA